MKQAVSRVVEAARSAGVEITPIEYEDKTHTAQAAADAIGVEVGQIVKSLIFLAGDGYLLVLVSGKNRVDVDKLARIVGQEVKRADAKTVTELTGYTIGGVPPVGHTQKPLAVLMDRDLLDYEVVYAAAGTDRVNFAIATTDLLRITGARPCDIKDQQEQGS